MLRVNTRLDIAVATHIAPDLACNTSSVKLSLNISHHRLGHEQSIAVFGRRQKWC